MQKRSKKGSIFIILLLLIAVQFVGVEKNQAVADGENSLFTSGLMPEEVHNILKTSCYDCHSGYTTYPWYSRIQPVGFWLNNHITEGKHHLNFSQFNTYTLKRKLHKLDEVVETIEENEMPLKSYTWIHGDAKLSDAQKEILKTWVKEVKKELKK
jgi:hypothetical protein